MPFADRVRAAVRQHVEAYETILQDKALAEERERSEIRHEASRIQDFLNILAGDEEFRAVFPEDVVVRDKSSGQPGVTFTFEAATEAATTREGINLLRTAQIVLVRRKAPDEGEARHAVSFRFSDTTDDGIRADIFTVQDMDEFLARVEDAFLDVVVKARTASALSELKAWPRWVGQ